MIRRLLPIAFALAFAVEASAQEPAPLKPIQVDAAAAGRLGRVKRCYRAALKKTPGLFGMIAVGMRVAPDGKVGERSVALSTLGDPGLEGCVVEAFEGLTVPPPGEPGAFVRYGILLTTKETPPDPARTQEQAWKSALKNP